MSMIATKPADFFRPDPSNVRKHFDEEDLRLLGESLKKKQDIPLISRKNGMIVDGERRWRAAKLVGLQTLDAILVEDSISAAEVKEIQLVTALHRADLKPYEVYCGFIEWLKSHPGKGGKDLAAAIDRSEAMVSMTLSLSRCIPAIQEAAAQGKLGLKDWYALSQCSESDQVAMLQAKLNGAPTADLKRARNKPSSTVRTSKGKFAMQSGCVITVVGQGDGMTLSEMIEELTLLLKAAKEAEKDGLDSKTLSAVMTQKAKAS